MQVTENDLAESKPYCELKTETVLQGNGSSVTIQKILITIPDGEIQYMEMFLNPELSHDEALSVFSKISEEVLFKV